MKIYKDEEHLSEQIAKAYSLSAYMKPEQASNEDVARIHELLDYTALASRNDKSLYFHKAILVTTNWNKNDDIFLPKETWYARKTPIHKPTNLGHVSSDIVGHITDNWAISTDGKLLSEDLEDNQIPSKFHILTGAVIYQEYHNDPEKEKKVAELIEKINSGKMYVSMECHFDNFDYAILRDGRPVEIVERNESTAFLTKHLRRFGGSGKIEGAKLGRVLRDIRFIGKAYVERPGNPESIIFTKDSVFDFANASFVEKYEPLEKNSVVFSNKLDFNGDNKMSEVLQEQNAELKAQNSSLAAEVKELQDKLSKAGLEKFEEKITALTAENASLTEALASLKVELENLNKSVADTKQALAVAEKDKAELAKQVEVAAQEKTFAARVTKLVDGKIEREVAEAKVKLFEGLNEDQFNAVADELIAAKASATTETKPSDATKADEVDVTKSTASEGDQTVASDTVPEDESDSEDKAFASLVERITKNLSIKNTEKGDK